MSNQRIVGKHKGCLTCTAAIFFKDLCCPCNFVTVAIADVEEDKFYLAASKKITCSQENDDKFQLVFAVHQGIQGNQKTLHSLASKEGWHFSHTEAYALGKKNSLSYSFYDCQESFANKVLFDESPFSSNCDAIVILKRSHKFCKSWVKQQPRPTVKKLYSKSVGFCKAKIQPTILLGLVQ